MRAGWLLILLALPVQASSLDRQFLAKVMRTATPGFQRCYQAALKRDGPHVEGKVVFALAISETGAVTEVTVELPLEAAPFEQCLHDVAIKLRFPKGISPFRIKWPVLFRVS